MSNQLTRVINGIDGGKYLHAGACHTSGDGRIYSYGMLIAVGPDRDGKYHVNTGKYSRTTSTHQNACLNNLPSKMIVKYPSEGALRAAMEPSQDEIGKMLKASYA